CDRALKLEVVADDVEVPEAIRQIGRLAQVVDGLSDRPDGRHGNELGLHAPAGRVFRVEQAARQRDPLGSGKLIENLGLLVLRQVLEDGHRIIGIELAHAFGHGLGRQLFEDFLADGVIDLGQRGKIEVVPHQLDELGAQIRVERLDQIADVGLVQVAYQLAQRRGIPGGNRLRNALDIILAHCPILLAQCEEGRRGHVFFFDHAEPCRGQAVPQVMERMSLACTLGILDWQSRTISTPTPMADPLERYTLRPPRSPADWCAYHAIRRDAIFAPLLPRHAYDERDPDEFKPGHIPHLLVRDGEIVGTVRIDLIDHTQAGLRLIGIRNDLQRQGHGAVLLQLAEKAAHTFGRTIVVINAHPTSLTFYLANGYRIGDWQDAGPVPATLIRVGKRLR